MRRYHTKNYALFVVLLVFSVFYIVPIILMVLGSFKTQQEAILFNLKLPEKMIWSNYAYVLEKGKILRGYRNSFMVTFFTTVSTLLVGGFAGITISRRRDKVSDGLYYYFLFGLTITLQIASTFMLFKTLNIYGTYFAVICLYIAQRMPFTIMTFSSFVKGVPREIDEAAIVDGSGVIRLYTTILMPIMTPIIVTNLIVTVISVWNNFNVALFFLNSSKKWTVSLTIYNFFGRYARDWQFVFAALVLTVLPIMILYLFLQRFIISGMTSGAVKG